MGMQVRIDQNQAMMALQSVDKNHDGQVNKR